MAKTQEEARVAEHERAALDTYELTLESPRIASRAKPGQFAMVRVRRGLDPLLRRPFSFHRIDSTRGIVKILYRVVGRGTWLLSKTRPGEALSLLGPLGNGFHLPQEPSETVVLLAGGIGIAPLGELAHRLSILPPDRKPGSLHLFYGARTASEFLSPEVFPPDLRIHWSTDDGSRGYCGFVTQALEQATEDGSVSPSLLYACGPPPMQRHVALWALERRVPAELSLESLMACGIQACLGCAVPAVNPADPDGDHYLHVCKEGPVFQPGAIQWSKIPLPPTSPPPSLCNWGPSD